MDFEITFVGMDRWLLMYPAGELEGTQADTLIPLRQTLRVGMN